MAGKPRGECLENAEPGKPPWKYDYRPENSRAPIAQETPLHFHVNSDEEAISPHSAIISTSLATPWLIQAATTFRELPLTPLTFRRITDPLSPSSKCRPSSPYRCRQMRGFS